VPEVCTTQIAQFLAVEAAVLEVLAGSDLHHLLKEGIPKHQQAPSALEAEAQAELQMPLETLLKMAAEQEAALSGMQLAKLAALLLEVEAVAEVAAIMIYNLGKVQARAAQAILSLQEAAELVECSLIQMEVLAVAEPMELL